MAAQLARRFIGRGEPWGDLNQVANIGLIKAVDRYDPGRGGTFAGYAVPTILGEIKRHFRDFTWTVRVSRRLQEARIELVRADEEVTRRVQRSPTTAELAAALGVQPTDVDDARQAGNAYRPLTAQRLVPDGEILSVLDTIGALDPGFESVERRMMLRLLLAGASDQDRGLIGMRFADGLTQGEIATRIGVSQMQVSRLLAQLLTRLHDQMVGAPDSGWTARTPAVHRSRGVTPRG
jgi:RNA polymerase sigma-B factor